MPLLHLPLPRLLTLAALLRLILFLHGLYQDAHSTLKYTDIDYYVFTDASRFVSQGLSPYLRATYRYPPVLAYLLLPTTTFFSFGKLVFSLSDLIAGFFIHRLLTTTGTPTQTSLYLTAATWLLNPMVATISTRGSSEGLLGVLIILLLWASVRGRPITAGLLLALSVHFKIYPIIYTPSILLSLSSSRDPSFTLHPRWFISMITRERLQFAFSALGGFIALNAAMYWVYGWEYLHHSLLHHFTRLDHRHNFSPYHLLLYLTSASSVPSTIAKAAFLPQMLLAGVIIPLAARGRSLGATWFAQTFAFVAFNKVCTSQYFMWYLVLLPFMLGERTALMGWKGMVGLVGWVLGQAAWLAFGYKLEFLGESVWVGMWIAGLAFFVVNCWILGVVVEGLARGGETPVVVVEKREVVKTK